jgi:antirestriction protein ArdC
MKSDLYQRITHRMVADLEHRVRARLQPWNSGHMVERITRPLR